MLWALLTGLLASAAAQGRASELPPAQRLATKKADKPRVASRASGNRETSSSWHAHHGLYFQRNWGVDIVGVRPTSSGYMLRFDYRVVDPEKAQVLADHKVRPYLIDEATQTALAVPAMEKIGELRQVTTLEANRTYFMIFGNPGKLVKRGSLVTIVVGNLRIEGLPVD